MTVTRADFPWKIRKLIAERAGYRCSKPDCRRATLGPGPGPDDVASTGVACHIYAAAPGGPRGTGGLPFDQRQAASNGVWLCADHARLIDTNGGRGYPPRLLHSWRQLHEAYLTYEMRGLVMPCGLITEITVHEGPDTLATRSIPLSVLNLVIGYHNTGKSMLLDFLASAAHPGPIGDRGRLGNLAADIRWFDPEPHTLRLHAHGGRVKFYLDQKSVPFLAAPYRSVVLRSPCKRVTTLCALAKLLAVDVNFFLNLLPEVPDRVRGDVLSVEIIDSIPLVRLESCPEPVRLDKEHLHGAAAWIVLHETAIALAQVHGQVAPTLLLIDDFGDFLHPILIHKMFKVLTSAAQGFQAVVVTNHILPHETQQHWSITSFMKKEDFLALA